MDRVLVVGATGYLGKHIVTTLVGQNMATTALVRNPQKLGKQLQGLTLIEAEVTQSSSLQGCCDGVDVVISALGITTQQDGLSYDDVDFQGNLNVLNEALRSGVKKFIYVSVLHGDKLQNLQICRAKERFVAELQKSGLQYCVVRPTGFFSDMTEFYKMARKGRVYLFGNGQYLSNPIHGEDLAQVCVEAITSDRKDIKVGGPETLSQVEIAELAFKVVGKKMRITFIPHWVRCAILKVGKLFLGSAKFGPIEFFLNVMAMDMNGPQYGKHTLEDYFRGLRKS